MREFHLWLYEPIDRSFPLAVDYCNTCRLLREGVPVIHSTCITVANGTLFDNGYRLFVHFPDYTMTEIYYGGYTRTGRLIRPGINLERIILSGEFGPVN